MILGYLCNFKGVRRFYKEKLSIYFMTAQNKKDTGFGVSIDVIKFRGNTVTRIVNDWSDREMAL